MFFSLEPKVKKIGSCCMNMEGEDEYVDFYDFSKTYENFELVVE